MNVKKVYNKMANTWMLLGITIVLVVGVAIIYFAESSESSIEYGDVYRDNFTDGGTDLNWRPYLHFNHDNLVGVTDPSAPQGTGIGVLDNSNAGGFASLSYAITPQVSDFYLQAHVYCNVTEGDKGPLQGIAFLVDPVDGKFYRLVCDFKTDDPHLNLAYVGQDTNNFPVYIGIWEPEQIPGGVEAGWHSMAVEVIDGEASVYWDGVEIDDRVFVDRVPKGYAGAYTNYVGGLGDAATRIDVFTLKEIEYLR